MVVEGCSRAWDMALTLAGRRPPAVAGGGKDRRRSGHPGFKVVLFYAFQVTGRLTMAAPVTFLHGGVRLAVGHAEELW